MRTRSPFLRASQRAAALLLGIACSLAVLVACGDSESEDNGGAGGEGGSRLPTVPDDDFYLPPESLAGSNPGALIRSEEVQPIAADSRTFVVLYVSESLAGEAIAVSGLVVVPDAPAPSDGFNVVSWAHGTKGISDDCAPSRGFSGPTHDFFMIAPELVAAGYLAVSSDYEGLGTPGLHPYLVGESQARGSLDIVQAAAELDEVAAIDRVAVWGRSQGGQTALFASEIAPTWAPELDLAGVIGAAPACCMETIAKAGIRVPGSRGLVWMSLVSYADAFELDLDAVFTPDARAAVDALLEDAFCYEEWVAVAESFGSETGIAIDFDQSQGWIEAFTLGSPGRAVTDVPVLVLQGTEDETTPKALTDILTTGMCALGTTVDYRLFEGFSHNDSTALNMPLMLEWTAARFDGAAAATTCD
ncbi:MAG: lipase family protein [Myxococcota bacterium]